MAYMDNNIPYGYMDLITSITFIQNCLYIYWNMLLHTIISGTCASTKIGYNSMISLLSTDSMVFHDDVIKWKHFPRYWPFTKASNAENRLCKQSWGWWFETPQRSLWRHCNVCTNYYEGVFVLTCHQGNDRYIVNFNNLIDFRGNGPNAYVSARF